MEKNNKHTPEPWSILLNGDDWTIEARSPESGFMVDIGNASFSEFNARRIVACVNACAGIKTKTLEKTNVSKLIEDIIHLTCTGEIVKQRDELLAALEWYADEKNYFPRSIVLECQVKGVRLAPVYSEFGERARAALAESKEAHG